MKRLVGLFIASAALVLPAGAAGALGSAPAPQEYRPECEQGYQAFKPFWDAVLPPGKSVFGPMEQALCGEQKYTPTAR